MSWVAIKREKITESLIQECARVGYPYQEGIDHRQSRDHLVAGKDGSDNYCMFDYYRTGDQIVDTEEEFLQLLKLMTL